MAGTPAARIKRELRDEARKTPGGWVYEIDGEYSADEAVPPSAVKGAWKVDNRGELTGEFIPNPNYRAETGVARRR